MSLLLAVIAAASAAPAASPLLIDSRVMVERAVTAADGTSRIELVPPARIVPGDRVVVVLAYRNRGTAPIADLVLADPVPAGLAFVGAGTGGAPELSVDGVRFVAPAALGVPPAAVRHVRWRLTRPLAPGAGGSFSFRAVVR